MEQKDPRYVWRYMAGWVTSTKPLWTRRSEPSEPKWRVMRTGNWRVYVDVAPSGNRMRKQKELTRMLRECRAGKIDKILVRSVSRLSRNIQDCQELLRELTALGVSVRFEQENIDTSEDGITE